METNAELSREVDTEHEEEKVVEWGDASEETRGGPWGVCPESGGKNFCG